MYFKASKFSWEIIPFFIYQILSRIISDHPIGKVEEGKDICNMKNLQLKIVNYWNVQKIGQDNCSSTFNNIYSLPVVCKSQIYKLRENDDCIKLLKKFCCVGNNVITQTGYLGQSIMPLLHLHQNSRNECHVFIGLI